MKNKIKPFGSFLSLFPFHPFQVANLSPSLLSRNHSSQLPSALPSLRQWQSQHSPLSWASKPNMDKSKWKSHGGYDQAGREGEDGGAAVPHGHAAQHYMCPPQSLASPCTLASPDTTASIPPGSSQTWASCSPQRAKQSGRNKER